MSLPTGSQRRVIEEFFPTAKSEMSQLLLKQPLLTLVPPVLVLSSPHVGVDFPLSLPTAELWQKGFPPFL